MYGLCMYPVFILILHRDIISLFYQKSALVNIWGYSIVLSIECVYYGFNVLPFDILNVDGYFACYYAITYLK